jgi:flavin-dependent dehydrogenase
MSAVNLAVLDRLGVGSDIRAKAGPEIKRLALFASGPGIEALMPRASADAFGRALGRDVLDGLLLEAARNAGVAVFQPWRAVEISDEGDAKVLTIESEGQRRALAAPVIVAAHGSWEQGRLPSNLQKSNRSSDFFGFKAHFLGSCLPFDLMPLLAFRGGYGGMVWEDRGRVSLSCCVRRDALAEVRERYTHMSAAQAVHRHILASCPCVAATIGAASLDGEWLAAGPIRPGIRPGYAKDIFRVGNIAGESHPVIAEGISMALQSGWLLASELAAANFCDPAALTLAGQRYSQAWKKQFATRIQAASILARIAIFPQSAELMRTFVSMFPGSLSLGARLSGKTKSVPNLC